MAGNQKRRSNERLFLVFSMMNELETNHFKGLFFSSGCLDALLFGEWEIPLVIFKDEPENFVAHRFMRSSAGMKNLGIEKASIWMLFLMSAPMRALKQGTGDGGLGLFERQ